MASYYQPRNDDERAALLQMSLTAIQYESTQPGETAGVGRRLLPEETVARLGSVLTAFAAARHQKAEAAAVRRNAMHAANQAAKRLKVEIRSVWQRLRLQVQNELIPPGMLTYYGFLQQARFPTPRNRQGWFALAETLLAGDERAIAAGHAALFNRSELVNLQGEATAAAQALQLAEVALHRAQTQLRQQRNVAAQLCRTVINDLRHALHEDPPAQRRQIMRTYGVPVQATPGEEAAEVLPLSSAVGAPVYG